MSIKNTKEDTIISARDKHSNLTCFVKQIRIKIFQLHWFYVIERVEENTEIKSLVVLQKLDEILNVKS